MCKEIIDRHGGRLTIESEVGQGASFTIWLKPAQ
jgi:signal transduction histidine kinase